MVIDRETTFEPDTGRLIVRGHKAELNLHDGKNLVVVVRKGARSNSIKLKL